MLEFIKALLGPDIQEFIMVLFTRGDELEEDETIEQHIKEHRELEHLIGRCQGQIHVFNNRQSGDVQVKELLDKIQSMVKNEEGRFLIGQKKRNSIDEPLNLAGECEAAGASVLQQDPQRKEHRRLVLLGKTGVGNTILGRNLFKSEPGSSSQTRECSSEKAQRADKQITVIDTPGLFDTELSQDDVMKEMVKCMIYSSPGPHAFIIVVKIGRFTPEERETIKQIKEVFGDHVERFSMILFTYKDELDKKKISIQQYIKKGDPDLRALVESCGNRFFCLNNNNMHNYTQFKELMSHIESMVAENGGKYFSEESFIALEQTLLEIQNEKMKEKLKAYNQEQTTQTEWQKIDWRLLEESRSAAQYSLISDIYITAVAKIFGKINVTPEEEESAIKAAESQGINQRQAVRAAIKATRKLAQQKMCGIQ